MVERAQQRPYFFWDYDITEEVVHEILRGDNKVEKAWVITRILEHAKWKDIWCYLTMQDIQENLKSLRFRWPRDQELWAYAI